MSSPEKPRAKRYDTVGGGIALGTAMVLGGMFAASSIFDWVIFFWGAIQIAYMLPATIIVGSLHRPNLAKGLALTCAGAFLLNAACFAAAFVSSKMGG